MGKKKTVRCAYCHHVIDSTSQFCRHCGHRVRRLVKETLCPKCGKYAEHLAAYCNHCGFKIHRAGGQRVTFVHILRYFVSLLLVVLVLIIFFTILYKQEERRSLETQQVAVPNSFLNIAALQCEKAQQAFRVCGTYSWKGAVGDYVTVHVPRAQIEESVPFTLEFFEHCSDVNAEEGFRVVRMVLYNEQGVVLDQVSKGVLCKDEEVKLPVPSRRVSDVTKRGRFRAEQTTTYNRGFGTTILTFDGPIQECAFDGSYEVDDSPALRSRITGRCDKARGTFFGTVTKRRQSVTNDPGAFAWDYKSVTDPEPETVDGYFFAMKSCDPSYHRGTAHHIVARLHGIGTSTLTVAWEFDDDAPDRAAEVSYTLHCKVQTPQA